MEGLGVKIAPPEAKKVSHKLQGQSFVLTGELERFTREEAKDMIRQAGGEVSSAVSSRTNFLLAGKNPGSKFQKAKEWGVKIIGEEELKELLK